MSNMRIFKIFVLYSRYVICAMFQTIPKLNLSEVSSYPKFTLVDNTSIVDDGSAAILVKSKYESEFIPKLNTMTTLKFPDLFSDDGLLTLTAANFFEENSIIINKEGLSSAAIAFTDEGKSFNYSSTLTASIAGIQATICIHPQAEAPNSKGKKVDLNILGWYLILKILGFDVNIASDDSRLLKSAKTLIFRYLNYA